ncbi:MAG: ROK family protein [Clostridia bacterium]
MYYIGIDLGGTNIAAGIVSESGEILRKESIPTKNERESQLILEDMASLVNQLIADHGIEKSEVISIGVGAPGTANAREGKIAYANNLKFENVDIRGVVGGLTGLPVFVDNDANCAALAESEAGAAKGTACSVTITLGTGVGSGIISEGKIYSGFNNLAAEFGHTLLIMDGEQCTCGRKGCLEAYASGTALIRQTIEAGKAHPESLITACAKEGKLENTSARTAFDAARQGDAIAQEVVDRYIKYVGEGLVNLINAFSPEVVCVGGGISNEGENLLKPIREYVYARIYAHSISETLVPKSKIVKALMGNDAGIIGAAMLGKNVSPCAD